SGRLWGRFDVAIAGRSPWLKLVAGMMNWRSRLTGIATGDQAIFATREAFEREYLRAQIRRFSGNISRTAVFIGMERSALHRKLKALGLGEGGGEGDDDTGASE
ncbi:MAG TPA: helix-turn-helix domain-containing protein, partial [Polymorphobacter sp.]|nr:helix-turn-helix domain-containing protein [Polymorphobacter sp.]